MKITAFLFLTAMITLAGASQFSDGSVADTIFINGNIYPGAVFTPRPSRRDNYPDARSFKTEMMIPDLVAKIVGPHAHALAVREVRIIARATTAQLNKLKGAHT